MAEWAVKRFWKAAQVVPTDAGHAVHLDGRPVRTPSKAPLIVPTEAMAAAIAAEWDAQTGKLNPSTMPVTRTANSAIDKVTPQRADVAAMLAAYGENDLICYRAAEPEALVTLQSEAWNPWLVWAAQALDAPLEAVTGVMHAPQPAASVARLRAHVAALDPFALAGFHDLVAISGSLVLALAVIRGKLDPAEAWALSRLDEEWQISQWGRDEDADALAATKQADFLAAARFYDLCLT